MTNIKNRIARLSKIDVVLLDFVFVFVLMRENFFDESVVVVVARVVLSSERRGPSRGVVIANEVVINTKLICRGSVECGSSFEGRRTVIFFVKDELENRSDR